MCNSKNHNKLATLVVHPGIQAVEKESISQSMTTLNITPAVRNVCTSGKRADHVVDNLNSRESGHGAVSHSHTSNIHHFAI